MNDRVQFVINQVKEHVQNLVLGNAVLAFIAVPMIAMLVFDIKKDLPTLSFLTTIVYWTGVILWYSYKAKKEVN
jgi:hypothetical protein